MAKVIEVEAHARARASPSTVYAVAAESSGYPEWSMIGAFEAVRDGQDGPFGIGSRRIYRTFPLVLLEEVVELIPDSRVSYTLLGGMPLRGYRADIDLIVTAEGGTDISWRARFEAAIPGSGWLYRAFMQWVLGTMAGQLAREAERRQDLRAES